MQIFLDSANLDEIRIAHTRGIRGFTTNPSLLARENGSGIQLGQIIEAVLVINELAHLSVEVPMTNIVSMIEWADTLCNSYSEYEGLTVKVPIGWDELIAVREIKANGGRVNVTACMTVNQALMAANAGADYVSIFWGRIQDNGGNAAETVKQTHDIFYRTLDIVPKIIVGSIRSPIDVAEAFSAGADIVTVPFGILEKMCKHPQTDAIVAQFMADAERIT